MPASSVKSEVRFLLTPRFDEARDPEHLQGYDRCPVREVHSLRVASSMRYAAVETVRVESFKGGTACTRSASVKPCLERQESWRNAPTGGDRRCRDDGGPPGPRV